MADGNCNGTETFKGLDVIEFDWPLHVYRKRCDGQTDLYSLAVWKGTVLMPICLLQPIEAALDGLRECLSSAGKTEACVRVRERSS